MFNYSPSPDAIWQIPLSLSLIAWMVYELIKKKYTNKLSIYTAFIFIFWNLLIAYNQLFIINWPFPQEIISYIWYALLGLMGIELIYTLQKDKDKKLSSSKEISNRAS